jgi:hypothetical protein
VRDRERLFSVSPDSKNSVRKGKAHTELPEARLKILNKMVRKIRDDHPGVQTERQQIPSPKLLS